MSTEPNPITSAELRHGLRERVTQLERELAAEKARHVAWLRNHEKVAMSLRLTVQDLDQWRARAGQAEAALKADAARIDWLDEPPSVEETAHRLLVVSQELYRNARQLRYAIDAAMKNTEYEIERDKALDATADGLFKAAMKGQP